MSKTHIPKHNSHYTEETIDNQESIRRAALYVRVSSEEQAMHGESIADQLQALRSWASANGYVAPLEYLDEGFSARKSYKTRPALQRLLDDVQADRVSIIAFIKMDRWIRSVADYYKVQEILDAHHVDWIATTEDFNTLTTQGRLMLNLRLSLAEHEADMTGERIRFTFKQKRARGEVISGSVPLGYKIVDKKPVRDEETAPIMEAFWAEYCSTGRFREAIAKANAAGGDLTISRAGKILNNAMAYAGHVQTIETYAYITEEQAQKVIDSRYHRARATGYVHLFNGLIYCACCGGRMSAHLSTRRTKAGTVKYSTYFCARAVDHKCENRINLNENKIEKMLVGRLVNALDAYIAQIETDFKHEKPAPDPQEEINKLSMKRARLLDLYLDGGITKEEYEPRRKKIEEDIARLSVAPPPKKRPDTKKLRAMLPDGWQGIYGSLDNERKRAFWFQMLDRIVINPDRTIDFSFAQ